MESPLGFETVGERGYYRPVAKVTLPEGLDLLLAAVAYAQEIGLRELLLNSQGLTGHEPLTLTDRYEFADRLATLSGGTLRIAQVLRTDTIDPQRFGELVATNRGAPTRVFTDEAAALAWLDEPVT